MADPVRIWIDRGGTFTDAIAVYPSEKARFCKVLSSDEAPLQAIEELLGIQSSDDRRTIDARLGTTVATNALLERKGAPVALVTSRGLGDVWRIGDQSRPGLFDLDIAARPQLAAFVVEVDVRADRHGAVLGELDEHALAAALGAARQAGAEAVAVALCFGHRAPGLEQRVAAVARGIGFADVVCSHEVAQEVGLLDRGQTTLVEAYVGPRLRRYFGWLEAQRPGTSWRFMQSSGGVAGADGFWAKDAVLSGPAGGATALAALARLDDEAALLGFDMGGTSTDVCRVDDAQVPTRFAGAIDGIDIRAPMVDIHTVAAGGGSVCRFVDGRFVVGPESCGADPGPLCYGRAGARDLAIADINLCAGRLVEDRFAFPLDRGRAKAALAQVAASAGVPTDEVVRGFLAVCDQAMADAIARITTAQGRDVRGYSLFVFGGAGGQHACAVAERLGIRRILFHPLSGVLSAAGVGLCDEVQHAALDGEDAPLDDATLATLRRRADQTFPAPDGTSRALFADVHPAGTLDTVSVPLAAAGATAVRTRFLQTYRERFGPVDDDAPLVVRTLRATFRKPATGARWPRVDVPPAGPVGHQDVLTGTAREKIPVYEVPLDDATLPLAGPALLVSDTATFFLARDHAVTAQQKSQSLVIERTSAPAKKPADTALDPVRLSLFVGALTSVAEQMGETLRRTAVSANIKERLDFSCAVFDRSGRLLTNAPHIPVHLGAMQATVEALLADQETIRPGDSFAENDPQKGGSHLPDVTVISPVFDDAGTLQFFVGSRGHHADVGGIAPGSMPPFSTRLDEEGVVLSHLRIAAEGQYLPDVVRAAFSSGPHPSRDPGANVHDVRAQWAANQRGAALLLDLVARWGENAAHAYAQHVQDNAAATVRAAIAALPDGTRTFADQLDDGTKVAVTLRIAGDQLTVDFAGTGARHPRNFNAPKAVTLACVLYALRVLCRRPIPLCAGCFEPVTVLIPDGGLLDPGPGAAVVAGNVETSQRVVDVLLGAFGLCAASQGTMNNLAFGNDTFGYYETIAGGAGAGPTFDGACGVHTHMTNTRITDAEVLEERAPVRVVRFSLRPGSGGAGRHTGGDGVVRELEALAPLSVSILSQRRDTAPFGLDGGGPGEPGVNRKNGERVDGCTSFEVDAGERFSVETPGGGGFGSQE